MSNTNTGKLAFPVPGLHRSEHNNGMTLRDYFAAKAMQSFAATDLPLWSNDRLAAEAYDLADAMLKAREA